MKVLWFSPVPSFFDYKKDAPGGWVPSLESYLHQYAPSVELAIAFEHSSREFKIIKGNTTYYPINKINSLKDKIYLRLKGDFDYEMLRPYILRVIDDYQPDVIHCFGSEWPWGMVAKDTKVPIIVHMQGYIEIYHLAAHMVTGNYDYGWRRFSPRFQNVLRLHTLRSQMENELMRVNHFFMGRTEWDRSIVKYFSPDSEYFHCPEGIRPEIYNSTKHWTYIPSDKMCLITITNGGTLKGNEIILQTAKVMKRLGFNFEWRVAGNRTGMDAAVKRCHIDFKDVNVHLLSRVTTDQIVEELSVAHAYVHPAIIDNSPNSLCEAQLIGCPVVSTQVGGIPQMVEDGVTGILYPYNEPHTLAFKLMNLFADKQLMINLSQNELAMSRERHNPEKLIVRLVEIYGNVIKKSVSLN